MHRLATSFVLGYHGCDRTVADALLAGTAFRHSQNDYDWLGWGTYFWEANPRRGLDFTREATTRPKSRVKTPAVVGAVIELGRCLDLTTQAGIEMVRAAHASLVATLDAAGEPVPVNKGPFLRNLDCAVLQHLHAINEERGVEIDTVKGVFIEGEPIYPGSGFFAKTHIQIAVRNPKCIKGVFRVPSAHTGPFPPDVHHLLPRAQVRRRAGHAARVPDADGGARGRSRRP